METWITFRKNKNIKKKAQQLQQWKKQTILREIVSKKNNDTIYTMCSRVLHAHNSCVARAIISKHKQTFGKNIIFNCLVDFMSALQVYWISMKRMEMSKILHHTKLQIISNFRVSNILANTWNHFVICLLSHIVWRSFDSDV